MADHKRQHYVPRCYFKPFSFGASGDAINLINVGGKKAVRNAPVKGQCAKDYLYGEDLVLERAFQSFEGVYAKVIREVASEAAPLPESHLNFLREFAHLQFARTDLAMQNVRNANVGMTDAIFEGRDAEPGPEFIMSDKDVIAISLSSFIDSRQISSDLKSCIIKNEANHEFIFSDDPVTVTNRYHLQRLKNDNFGLASAGIIIAMPISPRLMLLCYDGDVYTIPRKRGAYLTINHDNDVFALNEFQYLKPIRNIYFSDWNARDRILHEVSQCIPRRPTDLWKFTTFVADQETRHSTRYRRATEEERKSAKQTLMVSHQVRPVPSRWLSALEYRNPPRTFPTGTGAGIVRRAEWVRKFEAKSLRR